MFFRWLGYSTAGIILGFIAVIHFIWIITYFSALFKLPEIYSVFIFIIGSGLSHGVVFGFFQSTDLRRLSLDRSKWVILSSLGWASIYLLYCGGISFITPSSLFESLSQYLCFILVCLVAGLIFGSIQSLAISGARRKIIWAGANALGFAGAGFIICLFFILIPYGESPGEGVLLGLAFIAFTPIWAATIGISTGIAIISFQNN